MRFLWLPAALALAGLGAVSASAQSGARTLAIDRTEVGLLRIDGTGVETWGLDGTAGQVVSVTVRAATFEPTLQIASPAGEELARDDDGGDSDRRGMVGARLVAHLRTSGRYLVRVAAGHRGEVGAYELEAQALEVKRIEPGVPARARYEDARGADVWSFEGEAGQIVGVAVHADGFGPALQLTSPAGERLAREEGPIAAGSYVHLVAVLPLDGRYYLEVHDADLNDSGTYRVEVQRLAPRPLALDAAPLAGIRFEEPADAWSFEGVAGQAVRVQVSNGGWNCRLIPPAGEPIPDACRRRVVPLPITGRYVLGLAPNPWWDDEPGAGLLPYDPPTIRGVAVSPLAVNAPADGTLGNGRADVWGFDGTAGQVVSVGLAAPGAPPAGWFFTLRLVAPGGETLVRTTRPDSPRVVAQLPADGRYLVEVAGFKDEPEAYRLTVRAGSEAPRQLELDRPAIGVFDGVEPGLDVWEFDGVAGQAVNVSVGSDALYAGLEILSPSGDVIAEDQWSDLHSPWAVLLPVSGRYRVRITAYYGLSGAYEVAVRSMGVTPRRLEMNSPEAGVEEGGVDYWSFEGVGGDVVSVTLDPSDAPMGLDVMSPVGEIIVRGGGRRNARVVASLPVDGRYVVRVWGATLDLAGAYEVAVRPVVDTAARPQTAR